MANGIFPNSGIEVAGVEITPSSGPRTQGEIELTADYNKGPVLQSIFAIAASWPVRCSKWCSKPLLIYTNFLIYMWIKEVCMSSPTSAQHRTCVVRGVLISLGFRSVLDRFGRILSGFVTLSETQLFTKNKNDQK